MSFSFAFWLILTNWCVLTGQYRMHRELWHTGLNMTQHFRLITFYISSSLNSQVMYWLCLMKGAARTTALSFSYFFKAFPISFQVSIFVYLISCIDIMSKHFESFLLLKFHICCLESEAGSWLRYHCFWIARWSESWKAIFLSNLIHSNMKSKDAANTPEESTMSVGLLRET